MRLADPEAVTTGPWVPDEQFALYHPDIEEVSEHER
jgi:hypothetical protein